MKFDDNKPIYIQIIDECKRRIITDMYHPSMKFPTVRELALEFGVNPNTIQRALSELDREGICVSERTSGRYICDDVQLIKDMKKQILHDKVIQFINDMKQYQLADEELIQLIRESSYGKND